MWAQREDETARVTHPRSELRSLVALLVIADLLADRSEGEGLGFELAETELDRDQVEVGLLELVKPFDPLLDHLIGHILAERALVKVAQVDQSGVHREGGRGLFLRGAGLGRGLGNDRDDAGPVKLLGATEEVGELTDRPIGEWVERGTRRLDLADGLGVSS